MALWGLLTGLDVATSTTVPVNSVAEAVLYQALCFLVVGRVYPSVLPDKVPLPAIVYQEISTAPANSLDGALPLEEVRFQIDIYATSFKEAKQVFGLVQQQLLQLPERFLFDSRMSDYEPDTKRHRISADFLCWHRPYALPAGSTAYTLTAYLDGEQADIAVLRSVGADGRITIDITWPDTITGGTP